MGLGSSVPNANITELAASGAITPGSGLFPITKAGVAALTLAFPVVDGQKMLLVDVDGHAHTVTVSIPSPPTVGINGSKALATFDGAKGSWLELTGFNGSWWARSSGVTLS